MQLLLLLLLLRPRACLSGIAGRPELGPRPERRRDVAARAGFARAQCLTALAETLVPHTRRSTARRARGGSSAPAHCYFRTQTILEVCDEVSWPCCRVTTSRSATRNDAPYRTNRTKARGEDGAIPGAAARRRCTPGGCKGAGRSKVHARLRSDAQSSAPSDARRSWTSLPVQPTVTIRRHTLRHKYRLTNRRLRWTSHL